MYAGQRFPRNKTTMNAEYFRLKVPKSLYLNLSQPIQHRVADPFA